MPVHRPRGDRVDVSTEYQAGRTQRGSPLSEIPKIRLFFEWGGGVLWCANDAARQRFDVGPVENKLPLPNEMQQRLQGMVEWHDTALNWGNPPAPSPWSKVEDVRFTEAVALLVEDIKRELGAGYEVINEHTPIY